MIPAATILVVEDNAVTRKMLRVSLEAEGYSVIEAPDARVALAAVRRKMPDLVLQDLILPDADGFELAKQIRSQPGGHEVPIVALSGFLARIDDARTTDAGFTALLVKPIEPSRLVEVVGMLLPKPHADAPIRETLRLLVVDDDPVQLKLLRLHLSQLGFAVREAASAQDALAAARREKPDVIASDVLMPVTDGFQLCAEVRRDPFLRDVPVVLLSAHYDTPLDAELADKVGASQLVYRTPDLQALGPAILRARRVGPRPLQLEPTEAVRLEHARVVIRQLEHQLGLNAGLARRCTLQAAQLSLLGGVADALSRRADTDVALRDVLAATLDAAAISKGALFLCDGGGHMAIRHALGFSDLELSELDAHFRDAGLLEVWASGKVPISLPSPMVPEQVSRTILEAANLTSLEVVPLVSEGQGVGLMMLGAKRGDLSNEESVVFARAIGNQIVQSLELERSFRKLSFSEQRYRTLMENAHDAIAVLTSDGILREVNGRAAELLGLPKHLIEGQHYAQFVTKGSALTNDLELPASEASSRAQPQSLVEVRRPDGSACFLEFSNASMEIGGERLILAVGRDVTEELRARSQLMISDRMASIGMLAAGVAHEINNPLAAVVANLDLAVRDLEELEQGTADTPRTLAKLKEEIEDTREAAARVRGIVRDLKLFSRAEHDQRAPVNLHQVLDSTSRLAWNEIRHRARLVKDYREVPAIHANESRLGQVFLNMIVNAAQAIPEGHADANEIRVATFDRPSAGTVVVEIADTGCGMAPEIQAKLFTPFFSTKPRGVGTGLGLTICHRLVTELGGRIHVESELGRGTTFRIELPITAPEEFSRAPRQSLPALRARAKILVVDDEALVGTAVKRCLVTDHEVEYSASAEHALQRLAEGERFDVVLCDLMMPVMTGMELYGRVRELDPAQADRFAFLTGGAFTPSAKEFLESTENPHLEKPFDLDALEQFVAGLLK